MRARTVTAILALAAASTASAQYFGKNKIRYDQFAWEEYPTPHFRISFYDRERVVLPKLASFAESAYDELARKLNFQITEPIPIIAYATHAEFEQTNVIVEFIPEGVGAFAVPARNRMVLPVDMPDAELQQLIQHELTHVFQYEIMFQGKLSKALTYSPPQWFMEGMASYLGNDEDARARAVMRDAVLSDRVPSVGSDVSGYFAYRFGHMVFQFVESEWGVEGLRDFIFEYRNTIGGGIARPLKRAFDLDVEEFDARFRTWLRKYYQAYMTDRGDPREFGPSFRVSEEGRSVEASPAAGPSGDLITAFSTYKEDVDVVTLGVPDRRLVRNLTRGNTTEYQYLIAQLLTVGPVRGRDLAYSPNGDRIAVFARKERGRVLLLLDTLHGGIAREIPIAVDQAMSPAYSPDGTLIAFHAYQNGRGDIYLLNLDTGEVRNLTNDDAFDSAPTFTPDGTHVVYSSQGGEYAKLFEVTLANPADRQQLTFGDGDDEGAAFSRDGKRLYFASDRDQGVYDIYRLDLATHELTRLTRVIGAALNPTPVTTRDGERVVYQAYTKGRWWLYLTDPVEGKPVGPQQPPQARQQPAPFVPSVSVTVSPDKIIAVKKHKLFLDDAQVLVGFNTDNTLLSATYLSFSDQYGDRRFITYLESVEGYQNFRLQYVSLGGRTQWGLTLLDDREYFLAYDNLSGRTDRLKQLYRQSGGYAFVTYPFSLYHRVEGAVGFIQQEANYPFVTPDGQIGFVGQKFNVPFVETSLIGDTTFWESYGPHAGRRWSLSAANYFEGGSGTLSRDLRLELRQYVPLSRRNELALRLFAARATGRQPNIYYFGGLDTLRGYDYRSIAGNNAAYLNAEWRFPLIDYLIFPWLRLANLRGRLFVDVGAAYFEQGGQKYTLTPYGWVSGFKFMDGGRLVNGVASYGFGLSVNLFGLPVHWDWAKQWDFKETLGGYQTSFWIGFRY
ncbi:MAG: hypothetical protein ACM3O7_08685 [Acidobacteriota bacterium]